MALIPLAELNDLELVHDEQDCRGWPVIDAAGREIGTVREMLVDMDAERVTALMLDSGVQIPAATVSISDGRVVVGQTAARPAAEPARGRTENEGATLPVIEEEIRIGKRQVEGGGVRVTTRLEEKPVQESVTLRTEAVHVERRPTDRAVADADVAALKDRTLEVEAHSEEAVVDKRSRVVEEVVITKEVSDREETIRDSVRRTDVQVERLDPDGTNPAAR